MIAGGIMQAMMKTSPTTSMIPKTAPLLRSEKPRQMKKVIKTRIKQKRISIACAEMRKSYSSITRLPKMSWVILSESSRWRKTRQPK
jgi:hypothetical protein